MATASAATGSAGIQPNDPTGIHRYKLAPPFFDGDYSKYEDWKHKFIAYMALQHSDYTRLLKSSEAATTALTDADLPDDDEARRWTSMSRDLHYIRFRLLFHTKRRFDLYCNFCSEKGHVGHLPALWSHGWAREGQKLEDGGNHSCHLSFKIPPSFSHQKEV